MTIGPLMDMVSCLLPSSSPVQAEWALREDPVETCAGGRHCPPVLQRGHSCRHPAAALKRRPGPLLHRDGKLGWRDEPQAAAGGPGICRPCENALPSFFLEGFKALGSKVARFCSCHRVQKKNIYPKYNAIRALREKTAGGAACNLGLALLNH